MHEVVASKYASALLYEAKIKNNLQECVDDFDKFCEVLRSNKEFYEFLVHPEIKDSEKIRVLKETLTGCTPEDIINTIILLIEHDRIEDIFIVNEELKFKYYEELGIKFALVKTAVPLNQEEIKLFEEKLSKKYNCQVVIENQIDETLIGGVYLKVSDETIDETIKGRLERIKKQLLDKNEVVS